MSNWVADHFQLILAGAGAIAWWLNQRRNPANSEERAPAAEPESEHDVELEERTRRIREQIQRKIEERSRGATGPFPERRTTLAEPPVTRAEPRAEPPPLVRMPPPVSHAQTERNAEILEQQAALAERLRQAAEMKAAALRRIQFENEVAKPASSAPSAAVRKDLAYDLRDPSALRRAFLLREIIGPPVALRSDR